MKISVFTPTHNPKYLNRLYESLKAQTSPDWEWVVVPNGTCVVSLPSDPRIKVVATNSSTNIGYLKKFACSQATGEIYMEVDHDDELFPDAIAECAKAFSDPTVDFAYSNCCDVTEGYKPRVFSETFGWLNRPCKFKEHELMEMVCFEPDPASISKIWFAPNHFRAWRASFYNRIGGHDESMDILDDQDILCRTYIHGKMRHIDKPLYVYHIHEGNTCYGDKNAKIQDMTLELHDKYIYQLVEKWCDLKGLKKIDLCGGHSKPPGYESIDLLNGDIVHDLNKPWPFKDGEVGLFRAHDALEHLSDTIHVMKEAHRCLAPKGWFLTFTPSTDGRGAFQDPTHIKFFNSNSFWYYTKKDQAQYIGTPVRFQLNRIKNYYPNDWCKMHDIVYVKADLYKFDETGRTPGLIEI
jgi:glycosyltransferase involved in cell wall biosynthesis